MNDPDLTDALFLALMRSNPALAWWSRYGQDGHDVNGVADNGAPNVQEYCYCGLDLKDGPFLYFMPWEYQPLLKAFARELPRCPGLIQDCRPQDIARLANWVWFRNRKSNRPRPTMREIEEMLKGER